MLNTFVFLDIAKAPLKKKGISENKNTYRS